MAARATKDDPPEFSITADVAGYKYHAVLTEVVWLNTKLVFDARGRNAPEREIEGEVQKRFPRGIYGFPRVEDRDKFIRRCNAAADMDEHKPCFAVTIPPEHLANAQSLITGPVATVDQ
jgi:hypothetical protein